MQVCTLGGNAVGGVDVTGRVHCLLTVFLGQEDGRARPFEPAVVGSFAALLHRIVVLPAFPGYHHAGCQFVPKATLNTQTLY
jgi:hypothetical protein